MNKDLLDFFAQQKKVTKFVEIICSAKKSYKICSIFLLSKKKLLNNLKNITILLLYMSKESLLIANKKIIDFYKKNVYKENNYYLKRIKIDIFLNKLNKKIIYKEIKYI